MREKRVAGMAGIAGSKFIGRLSLILRSFGNLQTCKTCHTCHMCHNLPYLPYLSHLPNHSYSDRLCVYILQGIWVINIPCYCISENVKLQYSTSIDIQ